MRFPAGGLACPPPPAALERVGLTVFAARSHHLPAQACCSASPAQDEGAAPISLESHHFSGLRPPLVLPSAIPASRPAPASGSGLSSPVSESLPCFNFSLLLSSLGESLSSSEWSTTLFPVLPWQPGHLASVTPQVKHQQTLHCPVSMAPHTPFMTHLGVPAFILQIPVGCGFLAEVSPDSPCAPSPPRNPSLLGAASRLCPGP